MAFAGTLESITLADIFQNLATNHQTGTLSLESRDAAKIIFFQSGEIRYLAPGLPSDPSHATPTSLRHRCLGSFSTSYSFARSLLKLLFGLFPLRRHASRQTGCW